MELLNISRGSKETLHMDMEHYKRFVWIFFLEMQQYREQKRQQKARDSQGKRLRTVLTRTHKCLQKESGITKEYITAWITCQDTGETHEP